MHPITVSSCIAACVLSSSVFSLVGTAYGAPDPNVAVSVTLNGIDGSFLQGKDGFRYDKAQSALSKGAGLVAELDFVYNPNATATPGVYDLVSGSFVLRTSGIDKSSPDYSGVLNAAGSGEITVGSSVGLTGYGDQGGSQKFVLVLDTEAFTGPDVFSPNGVAITSSAERQFVFTFELDRAFTASEIAHVGDITTDYADDIKNIGMLFSWDRKGPDTDSSANTNASGEKTAFDPAVGQQFRGQDLQAFSTVPEPASVAIWMTVGVCGFVGRRKIAGRRKSRTSGV